MSIYIRLHEKYSFDEALHAGKVILHPSHPSFLDVQHHQSERWSSLSPHISLGRPLC